MEDKHGQSRKETEIKCEFDFTTESLQTTRQYKWTTHIIG